MRESKSPHNLSKDALLNLLSNRLNCRVETLNFLFNSLRAKEDAMSDIIIPDSRMVLENRKTSPHSIKHN